ncbi:MAG: VOC family protein [bacterium]|nr:VOC family protein [bacterium]
MLKSVDSILLDSILFFVKDPKKSLKFYKTLGFIPVSESDSQCVMRMNWFKIILQDETKVKYTKDSGVEPKGKGVFIQLSVENIDDYHKSLIEKDLTPSSEPTDQPWGKREFAISKACLSLRSK